MSDGSSRLSVAGQFVIEESTKMDVVCDEVTSTVSFAMSSNSGQVNFIVNAHFFLAGADVHAHGFVPACESHSTPLQTPEVAVADSNVTLRVLKSKKT